MTTDRPRRRNAVDLPTLAGLRAAFRPRLVGYHKAFELMASGDLISAADAERLGIVSRVVPAAELDAAVDTVAERLAASPHAAAPVRRSRATGSAP